MKKTAFNASLISAILTTICAILAYYTQIPDYVTGYFIVLSVLFYSSLPWCSRTN